MSTAAGKPPIEVTEQEWAMMQDILQQCIPGRPVTAYGSRARRENVWKYSDLDLLLGGPPLSGLAAHRLESAFDESRVAIPSADTASG